MDDGPEVARVLRRVRLDLAAPPRRVPSDSNRVFVAETGHGKVVVRLATRPRVGVDHVVEGDNARAAAALGIAPEVLWHDGASGELVTRFVPGSRGTTAINDDQPAMVAAVAGALSTLHGGPSFANRFDPFTVIDGLLTALGSHPGGAAASALLDDLAGVRASLAAVAPEAPCHNDPWPGNVLLHERVATLVDWEYAGQNDPAWDLADFVMEAKLPAAAEQRLLRLYGEDDGALEARVTMWKPFVDVFWSVWSLVEDAAGNDADDFLAEADRRLQRARSVTPSAHRAAGDQPLGEGSTPEAAS